MSKERLIEGYLTSEIAAKQLDIHAQTLLRIARDGEIRYRKVGKRFYFTMQDLEEYLSSQIVEPNARKKREPVALKHIEDNL